MDYKRIYAAFIKDRLTKQPTRPDYFERHHIMPRSLGGGDESENLIRLTPEDHYFAHLLLARIHGGALASALQLLADVGSTRWSRRMGGRRAYGFGQRLASRLKSKAWEGEENPLFNATEYNWANYRTGETRRATIYAMHAEFGASRPSWTNVAAGYRPSIRGWLLSARLAQHMRSEKGELFTFVNRDGRTFRGTQGEFAASAGVSLASASRIVRHKSVTRCGWRLEGVIDRPHNFAKDGLPSRQRRASGLSAT